jgi:CHAT domain-containing protein
MKRLLYVVALTVVFAMWMGAAQGAARLQRFLGKQGVVVAQEDKATPERARQMAQSTRVAHFACHARADDVDPLGSGLLLRTRILTTGLGLC